MIALLSYPQGDNLSRYYASGNPLTFSFQADGRGAGAFNVYEFDSAYGLILTPQQASVMNVGDVIMINGTITNVSKITESDGIDPAFVEVSPPVPFSNPNITIKSVNNYRAEFRVFHGRKEQDNAGNLLMKQVGPVIEATPDNTGLIEFNVQPFIQPFIKPVMRLSTIRKNTNSLNTWGRFFIQYRERFDGDGLTNESGWVPSIPGASNMRWYVAAVRELMTGSVTLHPYNAVDGSGQFLTAFERPEYIAGFPDNEISFIWPESQTALKVTEQRLNINKQPISQVVTPLLNDGIQEVNRIRLGVHDSAFVGVSVDFDSTQQAGYVQPGYVLVGYFEMV